jgi:hypothetical protein
MQDLKEQQQKTVVSHAERLRRELQVQGAARFTAADYLPGTVRHVVLFRYKESVSAAQRHEVATRFLALQTACERDGKPYIVSIEAGAQHSGEGADQDFEHGFVVTFRSQGDRNYYTGQPIVTDRLRYDPVHQGFKDFALPHLAGVLIFDYTVGQF